MNKPKIYLSAMITIEATIIMPIIFMVLIILMCFSFYLHDVTVTRSFLSSSINGSKNSTESCEQWEESIKKQLKEKLLLGSIKEINNEHFFYTNKKKIKISFSMIFLGIEKEEIITVKQVKYDFMEEMRRKKILE